MIELQFKANQLGSRYLRKDLLTDLPMPIKVNEVMKASAVAGIIGVGQSFDEDKKELQHGPLTYISLGIEDQTPLEQRSLTKASLLHIDLRLINPDQAPAVEPHLEVPVKYLTWEELMIDILQLKDNSNIKAFQVSGYCPDRDRGILLGSENSALNFHLKSSQETHQFTLALLYNCMEVLSL